MIGTGLQDRLGNIAENSQRNAAALRAAGVELDEYNVPGVHTWHVWRPLLNHYIRDVIFDDDKDGVPDSFDVCEETVLPDAPTSRSEAEPLHRHSGRVRRP